MSYAAVCVAAGAVVRGSLHVGAWTMSETKEQERAKKLERLNFLLNKTEVFADFIKNKLAVADTKLQRNDTVAVGKKRSRTKVRDGNLCRDDHVVACRLMGVGRRRGTAEAPESRQWRGRTCGER